MRNIINQAFNNAMSLSELSADGNRYSKDFTGLRIYLYNKRGKIVDDYSASQKNITGLKFQAQRFLDRAFKEGKHTIEIKVD